MNRNDFMRQLESLLQNIAPAEREEALQYYNDYFDDAGKENEQEVIEALGNPARVAESIRRDLPGSGYGEGAARKASVSDRALMEYGEGGGSFAGYGDDNGDSAAGYAQTAPSGDFSCSQDQNAQGWGQAVSERPKKGTNMPAWAIALIVTLLVFGFPVLLGLAMSAFGGLLAIFLAWFGLIIAFGVVSLCMLVVLAVLVVVGFMCVPVNPWVGMTLIGSGLVCGAIGVLFLMLTVAVGSVVPAACRGLASLFRKLRKKAARG